MTLFLYLNKQHVVNGTSGTGRMATCQHLRYGCFTSGERDLLYPLNSNVSGRQNHSECYE